MNQPERLRTPHLQNSRCRRIMNRQPRLRQPVRKHAATARQSGRSECSSAALPLAGASAASAARLPLKHRPKTRLPARGGSAPTAFRLRAAAFPNPLDSIFPPVCEPAPRRSPIDSAGHATWLPARPSSNRGPNTQVQATAAPRQCGPQDGVCTTLRQGLPPGSAFCLAEKRGAGILDSPAPPTFPPVVNPPSPWWQVAVAAPSLASRTGGPEYTADAAAMAGDRAPASRNTPGSALAARQLAAGSSRAVRGAPEAGCRPPCANYNTHCYAIRRVRQ